MKRSIAILLLLAMILGVFAGCKQTVVEQPTETPTVAPTEDNVPANAKENLAAAAEYLKTYYKDALTLTGRDFTRLGAVRVGLEQYPITWSVDVAEDIIKIVVNDDGTVTIDIADGIKEETPYVLTATLTDAYGNVETVTFEYTIPASLGTMQEIVDLAYALENGAALDQEVTLTGEIISVNTPYDAGYKNVTVTIKVAEREDYPIMCYRLKGEGADTITVGDTITVTGIIKNYNGTIEFDAGCKLEEVIKGDLVFELPSDPKEIVDMAYALGVGESIPVKVTLTGKVTEFKETYTEQYKNISVWMTVEGRESKPILVYRVKGEEVDKVAVGDTITVSGSIINYNGTIEYTSGCTLDSRVSGGGTPPAPIVSNYWGTVVNPGEAYYLYMNINGVNYYFNGKMSGNYLGASTNSGDAVEVYAEDVYTYARHFYFMDNGVKKYIEVYEYTRESDGKLKGGVKIVDTPSNVFWYDADAHVYVVYGSKNDAYFMGTYGTYTTFSVSSTYYITGNNAPNAGVTQYIGDFMPVAEAPAPEEKPDEPETPVSTLTFVDEPAVGTAYKFAMQQNGIDGKPTLGITGEMSDFYFATSETVSEMVDVYLEEAEGGYHIYFMNGETKTYLDVIPRDTDATKTNVVFQTSGEHSVYTLNTEFKYVVTTVNGTDWYLGTYGTNKTFSASKTSYISDTTTIGVSQFCGWFGTPAEGGSTEPEQPDVPDVPEVPTEPTYVTSVVPGTAYKLGLFSTNKNATYYFTGTMSSYYGATQNDYAKGIDMFVEETTGGYYLYFLNTSGVKQYVSLVPSGTHRNFTYSATANSVFSWDAEKNALYTTVSGEVCYMGTYGNYVTVGVLQSSKLKDTDYIARLYTMGGTTEPDVPEVNEDEEAAKTVDALIDAIGTVTKDSEAAIKAAREAYNKLTDAQKALVTKLAVLEAAERALEELNKPVDPEVPAEPTYVTSVVPGTAYKLGLFSTNKNATYYFTGTMSSYYGATQNDYAKGIDMFVEETTGGYYLYFLNTSGVKQYVSLVPSGTHRNFTYSATANSVFSWDAEKNALYTTVSGEVCYMGTYGNYVTVGVLQSSKLKDTDYIARLYTMGGSSEPEEPACKHTNTKVEGAKEATCTEPGFTGNIVCAACGVTVTAGTEIPVIAHNYVDGKCECGAVDPNYTPVEPETPAASNKADFNTINSTGDSSYTKTFTTANGWVIKNSAIQAGGATVMNPQYPVIGPDNSYKAVCMNGKTSAPGSITSPTLTGGISKLTMKYTKMFTDTKLSATITITDLATGNTYTNIAAIEWDKNTKYEIETFEWTLATPVTGDFTIAVVNNCPTSQNANKDRMTILELAWEPAAEVHEHKYEATTTATCVAAGITTYTCECGDTYTEETAKLGHIDENLDVDCDRDGCTGKVAPAADSLLSNFTANNLGSKLSSSYQYYVQGTIVEVLDAKNGVFLIDDGTGETFYFRLPKNADGVSHANWAIKLTLGDKVKVYGKINKYSTSSAPNGQYWPAIQSGVVTLLEQHPHDFTFSPADCRNPASCACGQTNGSPRGCVDADGNSICDDCGKNTKYAYEYVEIRTDNNSGVHDATAYTYTWTNGNFGVQVAKASGGNLYVTAKDHMRLYKGNQLVLVNKNGLTVKTITVYLTNATQIGNFEKFLTGYTYTKNEVDFTITVEVDSFETLTLTNPSSNGSTTQIKGVEFGYAK